MVTFGAFGFVRALSNPYNERPADAVNISGYVVVEGISLVMIFVPGVLLYLWLVSHLQVSRGWGRVTLVALSPICGLMAWLFVGSTDPGEIFLHETLALSLAFGLAVRSPWPGKQPV